MKITITIDTGNAAFDGPGLMYEVQRILKAWINGSLVDGEPVETALVDINGNTVGKVEVEREGEEATS